VLTARQVYLPSLAGSSAGSAPALRTASVAALDQIRVTDNITADYGVSLDSITFLNRMNYANVFGRATYELNEGAGAIRAAFVSAAQPESLIARQGDAAADLSQDLTLLSRLPRVSRENGNLSVQRNQNMEAGYELVRGSRTYSASVYREDI